MVDIQKYELDWGNLRFARSITDKRKGTIHVITPLKAKECVVGTVVADGRPNKKIDRKRDGFVASCGAIVWPEIVCVPFVEAMLHHLPCRRCRKIHGLDRSWEEPLRGVILREVAKCGCITCHRMWSRI